MTRRILSVGLLFAALAFLVVLPSYASVPRVVLAEEHSANW